MNEEMTSFLQKKKIRKKGELSKKRSQKIWKNYSPGEWCKKLINELL